jgi:hypothetical protein
MANESLDNPGPGSKPSRPGGVRALRSSARFGGLGAMTNDSSTSLQTITMTAGANDAMLTDHN